MNNDKEQITSNEKSEDVLADLSKVFTEKGYEVLVVPETATEIINMGIKPFGDNKINMYDFQKFILSHQLEKERLIDEYINLNENKNISLTYETKSIIPMQKNKFTKVITNSIIKDFSNQF